MAFRIYMPTKHIRPISELHPSVQALIGIARKKGESEIEDINGKEIAEEYFLPQAYQD